MIIVAIASTMALQDIISQKDFFGSLFVIYNMYPNTFYRVSVKALIKDGSGRVLVLKENQVKNSFELIHIQFLQAIISEGYRVLKKRLVLDCSRCGRGAG